MKLFIRETLTLAIAAIAPMMAAGLALPATSAYVRNENVATDTVAGTLTTDVKPRGLAMGNAGKALNMSDQSGNVLVVVNLERQAVTEHIKSQESAEGNGRWGSVSVNDTDSRQTTRKINVGDRHGA